MLLICFRYFKSGWQLPTMPYRSYATVTVLRRLHINMCSIRRGDTQASAWSRALATAWSRALTIAWSRAYCAITIMNLVMYRLPHYRGIPYFTSLCSQPKPKTLKTSPNGAQFRFKDALRRLVLPTYS